MRNIFLILVLANLGFAAWISWIVEEPAADAVLGRTADLPTITLRSEVKEPPASKFQAQVVATQPEEPEVQLAIAEAASRCFSIGPFSSVAQYDEVAEALRSSDLESIQRSEDGEVWLGHWVYLPDVTNQDQADNYSEQLAEIGVDDTYFDPSGVDGDVLSLGLFRDFVRAETLRERVLVAGFTPEMVNRTRPGTLYWANIESDDAMNIDLPQSQSQGQIVRMEPRTCADPDSSTG
jgi:hypothetical protein